MEQQFQNNYVSRLQEPCDYTATVLYVDTPPTITKGYLCLEYDIEEKFEIIYFNGIEGHKLLNVVRGCEGTTASTHNINADIRQNVTAGMLYACLENEVNDATITIKQGGVTKGSFTTNQGTDATISLDSGGGELPSNVVYFGQGTPETPSPWIEATDIIWATMINKIYPIGSIFMSATLSTASAVGNALGGTWEAWGAGRVPVGVDTTQTEFDTVEETGGDKTHTLTVNEMPGHTHTIRTCTTSGVNTVNDKVCSAEPGSSWNGNGHAETSIDYSGGDQAHNNLQPYITCYMYKRIA